jgi:hypothetical protein
MNKKLFQIFFLSILSVIPTDIKASLSDTIDSEKTFVQEHTPEDHMSEQVGLTPRIYDRNDAGSQTITITSRRLGSNAARVLPAEEQTSSMYTRGNFAFNLHDLPFDDPRARLDRIREVNENTQRLRNSPNIDCNCAVS